MDENVSETHRGGSAFAQLKRRRVNKLVNFFSLVTVGH